MGPEHNALLIVGLGNPGSKYSNTRHNVGFDVIDRLVSNWKLPTGSEKFHGEFHNHSILDKRVFLLKPQTFMNRSGLAASEASNFFKVPTENVIVVSDDLDLPPGALRLRQFGGPGGHNGLKSVIDSLGSDQFPRIRIGIGRSPVMASDAYVLSKIPASERALYDEAVSRCADAVECIVKEGFLKAMNQFNSKRQTP